jgi:hypothetical protein
VGLEDGNGFAVLSLGRDALVTIGLSSRFDIGLDLALELESHRVAMAVAAAAGGDADPPFGNAIFLDVGLFGAVEPDADALLQQLLVEERAARVEREPVGHLAVGRDFGFVGH